MDITKELDRQLKNRDNPILDRRKVQEEKLYELPDGTIIELSKDGLLAQRTPLQGVNGSNPDRNDRDQP